MLYLEGQLGRQGLWARLLAAAALRLSRPRVSDIDLLSMNPHLRRDIGLGEGHLGSDLCRIVPAGRSRSGGAERPRT